MKSKIYILEKASRAMNYGIGTYVKQLTNCLLSSKMDFCVIHLYADCLETTIMDKGGYQQISIPIPYSNIAACLQYYLRNVAYLLKTLITEDSDTRIIFHLNFLPDNNLVKYLKHLFKCHIVLTVHYTNWSFSLLGDFDLLKRIVDKKRSKLTQSEKQIVDEIKEYRMMMKRCDLIICVAQHTLKALQELSCIGTSKACVINNGIADCYLKRGKDKKLRQKYHLEDDEQIIIFAGRLDEIKGVPFLIKAFERVLVDYPKSRLIIAGDGDFNECLRGTKKCWSRITFTGRIDKRQLYGLYTIANVGVVCSIHEEFGLVAIEMMMHALPLVVTDTSGLSELVIDGVSGLKSPIRRIKRKRSPDVKVLSEQIIKLLDSKTLALQLGRKARKRFLENYALEVFKKKMMSVYEALLN